MKPLFDTIRRILGRGLTQGEVDEINASLRPDAPTEPERAFTPAQTSAEGIALIHAFEGFARLLPDGRVQAYPDPGTGGAPWTIGWGSTTDEQGKPITPGTIWTRQKADRRFAQHLGQFEREVIAALGSAVHSTSQPQFDALVSFHYNTGAIGRATLTRLHKAGQYAKAADEFLRWNRAGGRVMAGLTRRRKAERAMYLEGSR